MQQRAAAKSRFDFGLPRKHHNGVMANNGVDVGFHMYRHHQGMLCVFNGIATTLSLVVPGYCDYRMGHTHSSFCLAMSRRFLGDQCNRNTRDLTKTAQWQCSCGMSGVHAPSCQSFSNSSRDNAQSERSLSCCPHSVAQGVESLGDVGTSSLLTR